MAAQVVCISRSVAALGEEIGNLVAERLRFRYVDDQIIVRAARLAQVDPKLVEAVEHRKPLLRALMDKLAVARELVAPAALGAGLPIAVPSPEHEGHHATPEDLRILIRAAIQEVAKAGQAVILAHGASMQLATRSGVMRVLVTASAETRGRRLAAAHGISSEAAAVVVATSDRERRDYFRQFYNVAHEHPTHYDLVINTDVLTRAQAAEVIASTALAVS